MAIFTNSIVAEATTELPEVGEVMGTMEASDQILYEAAEDFYKINAGLYISDVLIEQAVTEGVDTEALMEGTIKDFFKKIVEALKKFWAKVKAWFKAVIENIKVLFMSGEKFIKAYEGKLKEKKAKGFEYTAYKYTETNIDDKIWKKCETIIKQLPTSIPDKIDAKKAKALFGDAGELDTADFVEMICKSATSGATTVAELKKALFKAHRNNSDEPQEWIDFNGNSKDDMITEVKGHKSLLSEFEKASKESDARFNNAIKAFESMEKSVADKTEVASIISKVSSNAKTALSISQAVDSAYVAMMKERYSAYLSILKRYAVYKDKSATKESVEGSLLESAMNLI